MNPESLTARRRPYDWCSGLNILLGVWILISPFVLAFNRLVPAEWNNVIVGILVGWVALIRSSSSYSQRGWSWRNVVLALWLIISPFALGFTHPSAALVNNIVLGVVVGLLALTSALAGT